MDSTHEEDQTAKQGLYHPKMNDAELITYAQYVLNRQLKHDLLYELHIKHESCG